LYLIDEILSGSEPAVEVADVATAISVTLAIAAEFVKIAAPLAAVLFDTTYVSITMLSSERAVPIIPSPK
jgi:hypothetical protein